MTTITKEWLQQTIAEFENTRDDIPFGLDDDDAKILIVLKRALASLTAEPVRYLNKFSGTCVTLEQQPNAADDVAVYMPLYTAPPVPVQVDIEMLASALKNAPLAPSDNQGRPRAPVVPEDLRRSFEAVARLNNEMYRWTSCMSYNGSYVGEPEGLLKRNIREIEHIMDSCRAAMLQGAEPVSQAYELPEIIEGMEVSVDVSTCDFDAGHRYFGTVTEVSELGTAKNGYILLVQDAKPNFDVNGNIPVQSPIDHGYRPECECSGCKATARICAELNNEEAEIFADGYNAAMQSFGNSEQLNSPVTPDGYALVPVEPTDEMIAAAMNCEDVLFNSDESFCVQFGNIYEAMLAAAPQEEVK
ncbi:hypothetical protein [Salmonella enterica]|uniref:hypothetical protein n=1 Tax=Salmonella enterica TaxID=28901 RepID=UPI0035281741